MTNKNDSFFRPLEIVHDFNFINDDCLEKIANGKAPECFDPQGSV